VKPESRNPIRGHDNGYIVTGLAGNLKVGDTVEIIVTDGHTGESWKSDHKIVKLYHRYYFAEPVEDAEVSQLPKAPICWYCGLLICHSQQRCPSEYLPGYCESKADLMAWLRKFRERWNKDVKRFLRAQADTPPEGASVSPHRK